MADKKCPVCGLWNSSIAIRCDCGYDFVERVVLTSYVPGYSRKRPAFPRLMCFMRQAVEGGVAGAGIYTTLFVVITILMVLQGRTALYTPDCDELKQMLENPTFDLITFRQIFLSLGYLYFPAPKTLLSLFLVSGIPFPFVGAVTRLIPRPVIKIFHLGIAIVANIYVYIKYIFPISNMAMMYMHHCH